MVYLGSSIASGHVCDDDRALSRANILKHPSVDGARPSPMKRRLRERTEPAKKRRRRDQGSLCQLNFDELYIIFAFIYPMDLLNLARTCKSLRNFLMHKSSQFLWKTSLRQIEGLPDCPPDLTEPAYTNLVFYNRCHGCGKSAKTVLWNIRRRYCPACRTERLHLLDSHPPFLRESLPSDWFMIGDDVGYWVDLDQLESFMLAYHQSADQDEFLKEKQKQRHIISSHARECERWQERKGRIHRFDLDVLRKERQTSIFERLRQRGYGPEIAYFKDETIEKSYKSVFKKHKLLTDSEWDQIWPEWLKIMNNFRTKRLETVFYQPRRSSLMSEYERYVTHTSPDSPAFDILPHVTDLCRLPPFRDIIGASEETQLDDKPFTSAFAQLPVVVDQWTRRLDSEAAASVKIPSCLSHDLVFGNWDEATSTARHSESSEVDSEKLHLACAVFYVGGSGALAYPEVLSLSMLTDTISNYQTSLTLCSGDDMARPGSIYDRYGLQFLEEAAYIVSACGLDPHVASVEDMDNRNARLRCLICSSWGRTLVMNWRHAIWHARFYHCINIGLAPLPERWRLVCDYYIDEIQVIEKSVRKTFVPDWTRCLLCRPHVGDGMLHDQVLRHLAKSHNVAKEDVKEGVHYKLLGIRDICVVEMMEDSGRPTFRVLEE